MSTFEDEPIDPDVEVADRLAQSADTGGAALTVARVLRERWDILGVIAAGGATGAITRWFVLGAFPHRLGEVPWSTVSINASGSLLLGVLMVVVADVMPDPRLVRPFLGVGVLGGYTTFSTAALDVHELLRTGCAAPAAAYLAVSVVSSLFAVWVGLVATRALVGVTGRAASQ